MDTFSSIVRSLSWVSSLWIPGSFPSIGFHPIPIEALSKTISLALLSNFIPLSYQWSHSLMLSSHILFPLAHPSIPSLPKISHTSSNSPSWGNPCVFLVSSSLPHFSGAVGCSLRILCFTSNIHFCVTTYRICFSESEVTYSVCFFPSSIYLSANFMMSFFTAE